MGRDIMANNNVKKSCVYISGASTELYFGASLSQQLRNIEIDTRFGPNYILAGPDWREQCLTEMEHCEAFILVASCQSLEADCVNFELQTAIEKDLPVYIAYFESVELPGYLKQYPSVNMQGDFVNRVCRLRKMIAGEEIYHDLPPAPGLIARFMGLERLVKLVALAYILIAYGDLLIAYVAFERLGIVFASPLIAMSATCIWLLMKYIQRRQPLTTLDRIRFFLYHLLLLMIFGTLFLYEYDAYAGLGSLVLVLNVLGWLIIAVAEHFDSAKRWAVTGNLWPRRSRGLFANYQKLSQKYDNESGNHVAVISNKYTFEDLDAENVSDNKLQVIVLANNVPIPERYQNPYMYQFIDYRRHRKTALNKAKSNLRRYGNTMALGHAFEFIQTTHKLIHLPFAVAVLSLFLWSNAVFVLISAFNGILFVDILNYSTELQLGLIASIAFAIGYGLFIIWSTYKLMAREITKMTLVYVLAIANILDVLSDNVQDFATGSMSFSEILTVAVIALTRGIVVWLIIVAIVDRFSHWLPQSTQGFTVGMSSKPIRNEVVRQTMTPVLAVFAFVGLIIFTRYHYYPVYPEVELLIDHGNMFSSDVHIKDITFDVPDEWVYVGNNTIDFLEDPNPTISPSLVSRFGEVDVQVIQYLAQWFEECPAFELNSRYACMLGSRNAFILEEADAFQNIMEEGNIGIIWGGFHETDMDSGVYLFVYQYTPSIESAYEFSDTASGLIGNIAYNLEVELDSFETEVATVSVVLWDSWMYSSMKVAQSFFGGFDTDDNHYLFYAMRYDSNESFEDIFKTMRIDGMI